MSKRSKDKAPESPPVVLDATGDPRVPVNLILEHGSPEEVRRIIRHMATAILSNGIPMLFDAERKWLAMALHRVANGMDANIAFHLRSFPGEERRTGVMADRHLLGQVESLRSQGIASDSKALRLIASHNVIENVFKDLIMVEMLEEAEARARADSLQAASPIGDKTVEDLAVTEYERLRKQLRDARKKARLITLKSRVGE